MVKCHNKKCHNQEQNLFFSLFEYNPLQTISVDRVGQITAINKAKRDSCDRQPMIGEVMYRDYANGHQDDMYAELMACITSGEIKCFTEVVYGDKFLSIQISPFPDGAIIISEDVTRSKKMNLALRENEERSLAITNAAQDAIITMGADGCISFWNPAAERILQYSAAEAIGQSLHALIVPPEHLKNFYKKIEKFLKTGEGSALGKTNDHKAKRKDGHMIDVQLSLSPIKLSGGWGSVGILRDITLQKEAENQLIESEQRYRKLSMTDSLTKLFNRWHFNFELKREVDRSCRYKQPLSVIMCDVDDFKTFNDEFGHEAGDDVLTLIGEVIIRTVRTSDIPCRIGGEEFFIILPMTIKETACVIMQRIRDALKAEKLTFTENCITCSCGVVQYEPMWSVTELVRRADDLMMNAKKKGKDMICA